MRKEDCFYLGHISRKHGLKGEVIAVLDTDQNEKYRNMESVFLLLQDELVPFFIDEIALNSKGHFILKFEDIEDVEESDKLIGRELYLPLDVLPPLNGKAFYFHEVINFKVLDKTEGEIGLCKDVNDNSAQPIFEIQNDLEEILIPAVDEFIVEINREKKEIHLDCPPGLIDLYRKGES